jgi:2-amino-4-hydroxy-6-hydroxymethyldihydropteridine diphosphokinase
MGNCVENLATARLVLDKQIGSIIKASSIYLSEPWGFENESWFYNQMLLCDTILSSSNILDIILKIETKMGRTRSEEAGYKSRIIDIDIIYHDDEIINKTTIKIPHPMMDKRLFVLMPLCEIAPDFVNPVLKKTNIDLLDECKDKSSIKKL